VLRRDLAAGVRNRNGLVPVLGVAPIHQRIRKLAGAAQIVAADFLEFELDGRPASPSIL
jgi:hypothetical protein